MKNNWTEADGVLVKDFNFNSFENAMKFVNKVADIAESKNHHPDIFIHDYKFVRISLTTHIEGNITEKDREMARLIDNLKV